jgi:hypothetical protein
LQLLVSHKGGIRPDAEWGVGRRGERHLMDRHGCLDITTGVRQTCDSHGCCTLNGPPAAHGPRSDRVWVDRWGPGSVGRGAKRVEAWRGEGGGGCQLTAAWVRCEVRGTEASVRVT